MNAEFNWWLLIVGLVLGASLTWLVMSESVRRDIDVSESEARGESRWIAAVLSGAGQAVAPERVEEVLRLHREYLAAPPPDDPMEPVAQPAAPVTPAAAPVAPAATGSPPPAPATGSPQPAPAAGTLPPEPGPPHPEARFEQEG